MTHRVAVLDKELCQPKKCGLECIKYCPVNKSGADCIILNEETKKHKLMKIFATDVVSALKFVLLKQ